jgi:hypothetical protein
MHAPQRAAPRIEGEGALHEVGLKTSYGKFRCAEAPRKKTTFIGKGLKADPVGACQPQRLELHGPGFLSKNRFARSTGNTFPIGVAVLQPILILSNPGYSGEPVFCGSGSGFNPALHDRASSVNGSIAIFRSRREKTF